MYASTPRWASRRVIRTILSYPFGQLRVNRITAICKPDNARAIRFLEGIGFEREGYCRQMFTDSDGVILGLLRESYYG